MLDPDLEAGEFRGSYSFCLCIGPGVCQGPEVRLPFCCGMAEGGFKGNGLPWRALVGGSFRFSHGVLEGNGKNLAGVGSVDLVGWGRVGRTVSLDIRVSPSL